MLNGRSDAPLALPSSSGSYDHEGILTRFTDDSMGPRVMCQGNSYAGISNGTDIRVGAGGASVDIVRGKEMNMKGLENGGMAAFSDNAVWVGEGDNVSTQHVELPFMVNSSEGSNR
jgi:hypothetical protein